MFTSNPFAELSASMSPDIMQAFVIVMILFVVAGTLFDVIHKVRSSEKHVAGMYEWVAGCMLQIWLMFFVFG